MEYIIASDDALNAASKPVITEVVLWYTSNCSPATGRLGKSVTHVKLLSVLENNGRTLPAKDPLVNCTRYLPVITVDTPLGVNVEDAEARVAGGLAAIVPVNTLLG